MKIVLIVLALLLTPALGSAQDLMGRVKQLEDQTAQQQQQLDVLRGEVTTLRAEVTELKRQLATTATAPAYQPAPTYQQQYAQPMYYTGFQADSGMGSCANGSCSPQGGASRGRLLFRRR